MLYLIDGYNLLFKIGIPHKRSLEKKREQLICALNTVISTLKLKATIVFDGSLPFPSHAIRRHFQELEIVYTPEDQSADAYIIAEIERSKHPSQILVITSDRQLASQSRQLGAEAQTIPAFLAHIQKKRGKKRASQHTASFRDSDAEITRYLRIFEKKLETDGL